MSDDYGWWKAALAGEKPALHDGEVHCGYYAVQDRRSQVKAARWPLIAAAIWREPQTGELMAERGGSPVPVDWVWPYCATRPVTYETYQHWHATREWPGEAA